MSIVSLSSKDFKVQQGGLYVTSPQTKGTPGMLLIWADWCPHCHSFLPTYNQICKQLGKDFKCASIENKSFKESAELTKSLDFKYFPTIKFFDQHGKIIHTYSGDRSASDVLSHICKVYHHCVMRN